MSCTLIMKKENYEKEYNAYNSYVESFIKYTKELKKKLEESKSSLDKHVENCKQLLEDISPKQ